MYRYECWTIKKAEHRRSDAFELWCWIRFLRDPGTARISNQLLLNEISPTFSGRTDAEAETPMLWPPDVKNWLIWKDPVAGKAWRQEEKGITEDEIVGWHHGLVDVHEFEEAPGCWTGRPGVLQYHWVTKGWTRLGEWTELMVSRSNPINGRPEKNKKVLS